MPTYVYTCIDKHFQLEATHSMFVDPKKFCLVCDKELIRKPQVGNVKFNGTGFYTTDKNESK